MSELDYKNIYQINNTDIQKEFLRYFSFWPYFLVFLIICLTIANLYLRYEPAIFESSSRIEIIDKAQDSEMALPTAMTVFNRSMINLENDFIYLENMVDSLSYQDSLKSVMITILEEEIKLTNEELTWRGEQLKLTEQKVKLVKPSWYENKWLYFGYGATLSYAVITLINQIGNISNL